VTEPIRLEVVGIPASQGSKSRMPNGAMVDGSTKKARAALSAWRDAVRSAARAHLADHPASPLAEPVSLSVEFRFGVVASDPYRTAHTQTPDVDKAARSTFDALVQGGLLADDRFICQVSLTKRYCLAGETAGASIVVLPEGDREAADRERRKTQAAEDRKAARRPQIEASERLALAEATASQTQEAALV
jgi:Holliday junction resolvase RusA-like endonuclease